jgi:hypothetical protein
MYCRYCQTHHSSTTTDKHDKKSMRTSIFLFLSFFRAHVVCVRVVCCENIFVIALFWNSWAWWRCVSYQIIYSMIWWWYDMIWWYDIYDDMIWIFGPVVLLCFIFLYKKKYDMIWSDYDMIWYDFWTFLIWRRPQSHFRVRHIIRTIYGPRPFQRVEICEEPEIWSNFEIALRSQINISKHKPVKDIYCLRYWPVNRRYIETKIEVMFE